MRTVLPLATAVFALLAPSLAAQTQAQHLGFDRNDYPGDAALPALRKHFAFTGYWLNNPPGETTNTWRGKRDVLARNNFGFLVLFNGRLEADIRKAQRGASASALGKQDAARAIASAQREHFPAGTIIFLDQEEGGRLEDVQSAYLLAWTEGVA